VYLYTVLGLSRIGAQPEILQLDDRGGEDFPYFPVRRVGVREALDMMCSPDMRRRSIKPTSPQTFGANASSSRTLSSTQDLWAA